MDISKIKNLEETIDKFEDEILSVDEFDAYLKSEAGVAALEDFHNIVDTIVKIDNFFYINAAAAAIKIGTEKKEQLSKEEFDEWLKTELGQLYTTIKIEEIKNEVIKELFNKSTELTQELDNIDKTTKVATAS